MRTIPEQVQFAHHPLFFLQVKAPTPTACAQPAGVDRGDEKVWSQSTMS